MAKFNFSNVLGGAAFGGLNAFLQHNASRDGYAKQTRYEVIIGLPSGVTQGSADDAGETAMSTNVIGQLQGETARRTREHSTPFGCLEESQSALVASLSPER